MNVFVGKENPVLRIESLQKSFGRKVVLNQGAISFAAGVHFIVGPNGSGKTTLFKCLSGMHPFQGKAIINSKIDLQRDRMAHRRVVSYSAAEPLFPDFLRGSELIEFVCNTRGLSKDSADSLIDAFGMRSYLNDKVGVYSSGMKKKLGLVMGLVGFVPLILLDEPYSALDQPSRKVLAGLIQDGVNKGGTFLIASHLADLHAAFGDGIVYFLSEGQLQELEPGAVVPWLEQEGLGQLSEGENT